MVSAEFLVFERETEREMKILYDTPSLASDFPMFVRNAPILNEQQYTRQLDLLRMLRQAIALGQGVFTQSVIDDVATGGPKAAVWLATPPARQRELLEASIEAAVFVRLSGRLESYRKITRVLLPEIRMEKLLANNGQGFLDVLHAFCAPESDGKKAEYLQHKRLDLVLGTESDAKNRHQRLEFEFLTSERHFALISIFNVVWLGFEGRDMSATRTERRAHKWCENCFKTDQDRDSPFRTCSGCAHLNIMRQCYYCSEYCQRQHWRNGHKEECGVEMLLSGHASTFEDLSISQVPSQRRSLALRAQISNLAAADDPDALYAITVDSKRLVLLCRPSTPKREQLRERAIAARDRAIKTQAAEAIGEFYLILLELVSSPSKASLEWQEQARQSLKVQLQQEFAIEDIRDAIDAYYDVLFGPPPAVLNIGTLKPTRLSLSPALHRQFTALSYNPVASYVLFPLGSDTVEDGFYMGPKDRRQGNLMVMLRSWAVRSRAFRVVGEIYSLLCLFIEMSSPPEDITRESIKKQLAAEYEVDMTAVLRSYRNMYKKHPHPSYLPLEIYKMDQAVQGDSGRDEVD